MKKFYSLLVMMLMAITAMAVESTGTYTSSLAGMYNGSGDGTLTVTPNGDNYDLDWKCGYYHPMLAGMQSINVVASNVALVDNVLEATATFQDGAGSGTLKVVLSDDKTEVTYNAEISGMAFTASMTGTPISLAAEVVIPNLQMTNPQANTTVTSLPDNVMFMFDAEIKSVEAAAIQWGENEPVMCENTSVIDGNTVVVDITDVKSQIPAGNVAVFVMVNGLEDFYETNFVLGAEFGVESSSFTSKGGQIIFNQSVDFVDYAGGATVDVYDATEGAVVTSAELSLDDYNWAAINVEFEDELANGDYYLDIPAAVIMSVDEEQYNGGHVEFTVGGAAGGPAVFVSVSPVEGSNVDIDTEFVATFSAPVTYTSYYSDLMVGYDYLTPGDGTIFWQNDDQTEIHAKFDKETLASYGVESTEDLIKKFGNTVTFHMWKVKDAATGEELEYNDPYNDPQFSFEYLLGDPVLTVEPSDNSYVDQIDNVYFAYPTGIALADESKTILVMKNKEQVASVPVTELEAQYPGWMDDDDDDIFGGSDLASCYVMSFEEPFTEEGTYEIYVPAGTFNLGDKALNQTTIITYTIGAAPSDYVITPAEGVVTSLKDFTLSYKNESIIYPSSTYDMTLTNEAGETVATIDCSTVEATRYDGEGWFAEPIEVGFSLPEEITEPGVYTLHIPAGSFYVGDYYDYSEELTFTWTIKGAEKIIANATSTQVELTFEQYTNPGWDYVGDDAVIKNAEGEQVTTAKGEYGDDFWDSYTVKLVFADELADGTYTAEVPTGFFIHTDDNWNETDIPAFTVEFTVTNSPVTGISQITVTSVEPVYNIAGQRVNGNAKGIVIRNGKKHLQK